MALLLFLISMICVPFSHPPLKKVVGVMKLNPQYSKNKDIGLYNYNNIIRPQNNSVIT